MQIILDNLASIFIAGAILLIVVFIQLRGSLGAAESTINYMVYSEALNINTLLERDLENMLTPEQIADDVSSFIGGTGIFACSLDTGNGRADTLTFPTVADPDATMNTAGNPGNTAAIQVRYVLEATGDSADVPVGNTTQLRPLFVLNRYVGANLTASSLPYITNFEVRLGNKGALDFMPADLTPQIKTICSTDLAKVRFDFKLVGENIEFVSRDQRSTSQLNISRFGATVDLANWE